MIVCSNCEREFDPAASRWLCPHCHNKENCCDGAPFPTEQDMDAAIRCLTRGKEFATDIEDIDLVPEREEAPG